MAKPASGGPITTPPSVPNNNNYDPTDPSCGPWKHVMYTSPPGSGRGFVWADDIPDANDGGWHQT